MGFLSEIGVTALWNKIKANFGHSLETIGTTINLKNAAATQSSLGQVTLSAGDNVTITGNDSTKTITIEAADTKYSAATTSAAGLMSAADKSKLNGITDSADAVSFTQSLTSGTKVGTLTINGSGVDLYAPTDTNTHYTSKNVVGKTTATSDTAGALANGSVYLNSVENGAVTSSHKISGSGATIVKATAGGDIVVETTYSTATTSVPGLMSAADKTKLNGIEEEANKYTHPAHTAKSAGLYKVTVDSLGHVSAATAVAKADITALGIPEDDTTYEVATTSAAGLMSAADKTKLDKVNENAEVNQNAFSKVTIGNTTIGAASKIDTLTLLASGSVTLTPNATQKTVTISATKYNAATTSAAGLMSAADKAKLNGIAEGATAVTMDQVNSAIASAQVGAAMYKGTVSSNNTISDSNYKAGWYWVVSTAGTYVGETCEVGDMIFANTDKGSAYSAAHFDVVQNNIVEMTAAEVEAVCTL